MNRTGPRTEPWGTPNNRFCSQDKVDPICTDWTRPFRYDKNHLRGSPLMPQYISSVLISVSWSIVSYAALRSSSTSIAPPRLSTAWSISFCSHLCLTLLERKTCKAMLKLKLQQVFPQFTSGSSFYCATFACQLIISVQVLDPRKNK